MCERDSSQAQLMGKDQEASVTMIPGVWVYEEHMGALHMEVWHRVHLKGGLAGAGVYLEYLKCRAHGCMKST